MENSNNKTKKHKRRVRYKGTHPRKFSEKYKELNPDKFPAEVKKVKQRGQTPAGMHRPICVREICMSLDLKPGMTGIDCTVGYGGHAISILPRIMPNGKIIGLDVDSSELTKTEERILKLGYDKSAFNLRHMNFSQIEQCLTICPEGFDFILADLGVSSMQLDTPERGFSFKIPAPLDLRMDNTTGQTAAELLDDVSELELTNLLMENADEPYAKLLGKVILADVEQCKTTSGLAAAVMEALENTDLSHAERRKTVQRVFQAIRIEVNNEFKALDKLLQSIPNCLKPGGKAAILSFHSGEDRRVKKSFKDLTYQGVYSECVRRPIRASFQERHDNPRSSSAKLRWAVRSL